MCNHTQHTGSELFTKYLPINVDHAFTLTFTDNPFFRHFMSRRRAHDIFVKNWSPIDSSLTLPSFSSEEQSFKQFRCLNYTLELEGTLVSTVSTIETQYLSSDSVPGKSYTINGEVINSGVPFSNSFVIHFQYCLTADPDEQGCIFAVHTHVVFKKYVWGVKSLIEDSIGSQMTNFFEDFIDTLLKWTRDKEVENEDILLISEDQDSTNEVPVNLNPDSLSSIKGSLKRRSLKSAPNSLSGSRGGSLKSCQLDGNHLFSKADPLLMMDSSIGRINNFLVKTILILVVSILILNFLLFLRLKNLEESVRIFGESFYDSTAKSSSYCDA